LLETSDDHREGTPNPADPQVSSIAPIKLLAVTMILLVVLGLSDLLHALH
jgi:hypothetical protein